MVGASIARHDGKDHAAATALKADTNKAEMVSQAREMGGRPANTFATVALDPTSSVNFFRHYLVFILFDIHDLLNENSRARNPPCSTLGRTRQY